MMTMILHIVLRFKILTDNIFYMILSNTNCKCNQLIVDGNDQYLTQLTFEQVLCQILADQIGFISGSISFTFCLGKILGLKLSLLFFFSRLYTKFMYFELKLCIKN